MACCEKCWRDAGGDYDQYVYILMERVDNPCSPKDQAGQFWDEETQTDTRLFKPAPTGDKSDGE